MDILYYGYIILAARLHSVPQVAITAVASHLHEAGEILQTGALLHAQKQ